MTCGVRAAHVHPVEIGRAAMFGRLEIPWCALPGGTQGRGLAHLMFTAVAAWTTSTICCLLSRGFTWLGWSRQHVVWRLKFQSCSKAALLMTRHSAPEPAISASWRASQ